MVFLEMKQRANRKQTEDGFLRLFFSFIHFFHALLFDLAHSAIVSICSGYEYTQKS